ncbi:hypothetical protein NDU88_011289 [Pleurodeles waltl]|uniref:Uncharacterized protein n=1 Tax=Pleurodeles waltl TaxID=8319 RepID=A0AAV7QZM0_PLEWA|nr:hypothetical protein NDU88_011289 [Pleurodeles waltl]
MWNDPPSVVQQFHDYYTGLYRSRTQFDQTTVTDYLAHIAMSCLIDEHRDRLLGPLQLEQFGVTLASMPAGLTGVGAAVSDPGTGVVDLTPSKSKRALLLPGARQPTDGRA